MDNFNGRKILNMNFDWLFHSGDIEFRNPEDIHENMNRPELAKAGSNAVALLNFDDSCWKNVKLPHDFVIDKCEFSKEGTSPTGYLKEGIGWYRKTFFVPEEFQSKRVFVQFDGIYRDSQVWCNGHLVGRHVGGYMGFECELTEILSFDSTNTIAVRVDSTECEGWWYEGGGIYRNVRLVVTDKVRIIEHGISVKCENIDLSSKSAKINVNTEIENGKNEEMNINVKFNIYSPSLEIICCAEKMLTVNGLEINTISEIFEIDNAQLWELKNPSLYKAEIELVYENGSDILSGCFGIRTIEFNAEKGFVLNGQRTRLNGACGHEDFAGVGTALTESIIEFKVKKLMEMGCNAYRCSHNPPNPILLDICDRLGFLVIDETRSPGIAKEYIDDFITMIKRDRNHPCIIAWSCANEEMNIQGTSVGVKILNKMINIGKKYDDSRPFILAFNCQYDKVIDFHMKNGPIMNPVGVNYNAERDFDIFDRIHDMYPELCLISTESVAIVSIRGYSSPDDEADNISEPGKRYCIWPNDEYKNRVTCYGLGYPVWGLTPEEALKLQNERGYVSGLFMWTGFDYRGETFPFGYPNNITCYGAIDLCGFEKDWFYYYKANWTNERVLHILPHWNIKKEVGEEVDVWVFSNCSEVELILNSNSLGRRKMNPLDHLEWKVGYFPGELKAIGYDDEGNIVAEDKKITSDKAVSVSLTCDKTLLRANGEDVAIITATVLDGNNNIVYDDNLEISFEVEGVGRIIGTGNGNPRSIEHDKAPKRFLFAGKCMVLVETTLEEGKIKLTAKCDGLQSDVLFLNTKK